MDWFGSTHEVSSRRYNGRYGGRTTSMGTILPSTSSIPLREIESIDRAIAKSFADERRGNHVINEVFQLKGDEDLARALQESLKLGEPSPWNRNVSGSCYNENNHPRCDVCKNFIRKNTAGVVVYKAHPFWGQKYCVFHEHDGTTRCCSCERMESKETRYVALGDGRKLCLECIDSAVMDTTECQPLYNDIQKFYESMGMKVEQKIPLLLVERQALNEARNGETNGHYHLPETRGLCLSEEQTISTVSRQPRTGIGMNWAPNMRREPYKLTRICEVTAILILHGLPRLLTGTILAHEMMHAWLRLNGYVALQQDVEEGICQVVAHIWLTSQMASISGQGKRFALEKKLAEFFKYQIESDQSPVYGHGFRAGHRAVLKYGLQKTLDTIRLTGNFPF
ncbi:hypothetical protein Lser_V15G00730 [Lactuca serriola]